MQPEPPVPPPQSWEHLFDRDPHSAVGFRVGLATAALIHAAVFAVTWPTVAQAPPREPEEVLIPFVLTDVRYPERQPEPELVPRVELPPRPPTSPPVVSVPPGTEPLSASVMEEPPSGQAPVFAPPPVVEPPPAAVPPPAEPVRVGGKVAPPELLFEVEPRYPEAARRAGIQGVVILDLVIDTAGAVESVTVLRGLPLGLTQSAVDAVSEWRFAPSTLHRQPIRIRYTLTVRFTLEMGRPSTLNRRDR
ncbi:MAG TPA: TonB family protein [Candidatus Sulfomarinibacteraceae bacterium]|nr:TonB family protein [Candidatus Sulfomarinibacteraceae bacterium]